MTGGASASGGGGGAAGTTVTGGAGGSTGGTSGGGTSSGGGWPNEPAGSITLLDCDFAHPTCNGKLDDPYETAKTGQISVQQDPTAPGGASSVLRSSLIYPNKNGGTELHFFAPRPIRKVYVGLWWKPSTPFGGNVVGANKTFFVRSGQAGSNGVFMWVYRSTDTSASNSDLGRLLWDTQVVGTNTDRCGKEGLACWPNTPTDVRISPGEWHRIEAYFEASSCPTCYDGTVRWWITKKGGVPALVGDYPNFAYATSLAEWVWSETWDGYGNGTVPAGYTNDQHHFIDHLRISSTDCDGPACLGPGK